MLRTVFALVAVSVAALAAPAMAGANPCDTAPASLRALAGNAEADKAKKALRLVLVGERLCAAGGRGEAAKKFAAAAKALDTDLAALSVPAVANQ
jgi:hypothetical protein